MSRGWRENFQKNNVGRKAVEGQIVLECFRQGCGGADRLKGFCGGADRLKGFCGGADRLKGNTIFAEKIMPIGGVSERSIL
jgi:hypothetical protein